MVSRVGMILSLSILSFAGVKAQATTQIFSDDFITPVVSSQLWHIPTWVSSADGTYLGRTQFRCSQNATLPLSTNSQAIINVESYNPTGFSFYGTDLITNRSFLPGNGLIFTIYAKIKTPVSGGIVGGIYLYDLTGTSQTIHDEIDFELLTNDLNKIHTNFYNAEPLGTGHPDSVTVANPVTDFHKYVIKWLPEGTTWLVDEKLIRTSNNSPSGPMHFNLNMWVPEIEWKAAYNNVIQPTTQTGLNQIFSLLVESVRVDSIIDIATSAADVKKSGISFYPNPADDKLTIENNDSSEPVNFEILNSNGINIYNSKHYNRSIIDIADYPPGIYLIRFEEKGTFCYRKFIKK
jgi:hypothetical protein